MRRTVFSVGLALLGMLGLAAVAQSQTITGAIEGVVRDADGSALPGVTVMLSYNFV